MIRALTLAFAQLNDAAVVRVLVKSLLITVMIFVVAGFALSTLAGQAAAHWGYGQNGGTLASILAALGTFAAAWLLFRAVAVPVVGFFADEVVAAVERQHYPEAAVQAKPVGVALALRMGLMSILRLIGVNLLMLPVYAVLAITGVGVLIAFAGVNAVLLGRDLGEMVAARHLDGAAMRVWLGASRWQRALLGLVVTGLFVVPFVNFLAPIIGAATATHLYHGRVGELK